MALVTRRASLRKLRAARLSCGGAATAAVVDNQVRERKGKVVPARVLGAFQNINVCYGELKTE